MKTIIQTQEKFLKYKYKLSFPKEILFTESIIELVKWWFKYTNEAMNKCRLDANINNCEWE